ncbi:enoyl-CoA hydratase-related protein [Photobacterium minamisatsumaniensis]|uniref:enoyl-CoA hydratase-related protein n=1 Tax=Photobacterium minamisatsumaniensis TaxID=2910233 RepID=UPI003D0A5AAF
MSTLANKQLHKNNDDDILCHVDEHGLATITLNRTKKHNAFNADCIATLRQFLEALNKQRDIKALVLQANGKFFSAGADLEWMQSMVNQSKSENNADAEQLSALLRDLDTFPHPTLALVQGSAFGGALGLICCCDIVMAQQDSIFCFSEVKIGLVPATIAPYVIRVIGQRQARRYMLTAETFDAATSLQLGIVHSVVADALALKVQSQNLIMHILLNAPVAVSIAKQLCLDCDPIPERLYSFTSELIARVRTSPEGQEGLTAFIDKRQPTWVTKDE